MAVSPIYRVPRRRRREKKTDYRQRYKLLSSNRPRFVVRRSLRNMIAQIVEATAEGDRTLVSAHSKELSRNFGWKGSCSNMPSAYLVGFLCAKKALREGIRSAILDMGLYPPTKGNKIFSSLKGALDAGLDIPHSSEVFPPSERISGADIATYFESNPDKFVKKAGFRPDAYPEEFERAKGSIDRQFGGGSE